MVAPVFFFLLFTVATIIVHFAFAAGVFKDADLLVRAAAGPLFVSPIIWALATVLGGIPIVVIYWLIHHSRISQRRPQR